MTRHARSSSRAAWVAAVGLLAAAAVHAGGPLVLRGSGEAYLWPDGGRNIAFHPDRGGFGPWSHVEAVALTEQAFSAWAALPTSTVGYVNAGELPVDVDATNFLPYLFPLRPDGLSAIVYDADGTIFELLFGRDSGVAGFATPEWVDSTTGEILEGVAFLNGSIPLAGIPEPDVRAVMVHEFGHFTNLAHTVVNGQVGAFGDQTGPTPFDTFPRESLLGRIETMYPTILVGGGQASPHADDVAILSALYPAPGFFRDHGTITGRILAPDARTRLTGVNVIARNVADPFDDAVSAISSDFSGDLSQSDPLTGVYTLHGLTPGATYAVYADEIVFGQFSTPPRTPLPAPEELYNGRDESADPATDDPSAFRGVPSVAGSATRGIDIVLNRRPPGRLALGDDDFIELFPPFPFEFCGRTHTSLFVNANGNLTFGRGDTDFTENVSQLLSGPPRIAALWDDLNPSAGGAVAFEHTAQTFVVRWTDVPEHFDIGANSFAVTLHRASNRVDLSYGDLTLTGGLVGFSCGGEVTNRTERATDLSVASAAGAQTINGRNRPALFERFTDDNDLGRLSLSFTAPNAFKDLREPNDNLAQATRIRLPFHSAGDFSEIRPRGGDLDVYRFRAEAGTTLIASTRAGNLLDTLIGLFDGRTGRLLIADDDGGGALFSRIVYPVEESGLYALAVTTYPDFFFTGEGFGVGRYILDVQAVDGLLLGLGDDGSFEVRFRDFDFPFAGASWSSVWVNANGNLTFGGPDANFSEGVPAFLGGPPRIAPLWDDLNPGEGGRVTLERGPTSLTVTFTEVPEWFRSGANTFAVTMRADGSIDFNYGVINGNDGLVGITQGRGAADPGPTDLSEPRALSATGTTYELFGLGQLDLEDLALVFRGM